MFLNSFYTSLLIAEYCAINKIVLHGNVSSVFLQRRVTNTFLLFMYEILFSWARFMIFEFASNARSGTVIRNVWEAHHLARALWIRRSSGIDRFATCGSIISTEIVRTGNRSQLAMSDSELRLQFVKLNLHGAAPSSFRCIVLLFLGKNKPNSPFFLNLFLPFPSLRLSVIHHACVWQIFLSQHWNFCWRSWKGLKNGLSLAYTLMCLWINWRRSSHHTIRGIWRDAR